MIEERNRRYKEEMKNKISQRINNERLKYSQSLDKYMIKKRKEEALRKQKALKKYEHFVNK